MLLLLCILGPIFVLGLSTGLIVIYFKNHGAIVRDPVAVGLIAACAGFLSVVAYMAHLIPRIRSSTAALAWLTVPFYGLIGALGSFGVGWAFGCLVGTISGWRRLVAMGVLVTSAIMGADLGYSEHLVSKAASASTPPDALRALFGSSWSGKDRFVRQALARNAACPADVLRELAKTEETAFTSWEPSFRDLMHGDYSPPIIHVAENPNTPAESLRRLAASEFSRIRIGVVRNRSTPRDILERLACDPDMSVRIATGVSCATRQTERNETM